MKISVVTVSYNAASTISDTLKSVAAQNWPEIEHIVVDGASSDDTLSIVAKNSHPSLRIISEPDKGLYDAMNKGVVAATGDIVGFLNADDFYCRTDALSLIARAASSSHCNAVSAAIAIVRRDNISRPVRAYEAISFRPWMLRFGHMPPHPGFFARKSVFDSVGPFDTRYRIGADFDWMVRFFLAHQQTATALRETIVGMRQGGVSTAGIGSHARINKEAHIALRGHGYWSSELLIWAKYAAKTWQWVIPANFYPPSEELSLLLPHQAWRSRQDSAVL
jgi:glycosyltransferase involved in cell wall biosynthesis